MIKEDKTGPPENAVLQYRPVISFRVRKALGSSNPDWEDVVNESFRTFRGDFPDRRGASADEQSRAESIRRTGGRDTDTHSSGSSESPGRLISATKAHEPSAHIRPAR